MALTKLRKQHQTNLRRCICSRIRRRLCLQKEHVNLLNYLASRQSKLYFKHVMQINLRKYFIINLCQYKTFYNQIVE